MLDFMEYFYPELFYTQMSAMYNNPEMHPGPLDPSPDVKVEKKSLIDDNADD